MLLENDTIEMGYLIAIVSAVLLGVFLVQIGRARELASAVRNDPNEQDEINKFHTGMGMVFVVAFLAICVWSFIYYIPTSLGWGPNTAASEHGPNVDYMFNLTLFFTSIVFVLTHIALFYFAWKYRGRRGKLGLYWAHNETLEMVWMIVPAVVMTFLVVGGLQAWNDIMTDLPDDAVSVVLPQEENEYIEIEATGAQFLWYLRYPGRDGKIGTKYFTNINSANPVGQIWTDEKNMDDFLTTEIVLPVDKPVRVRITARDVLHNFYIRDMRVKTDAVPGMPTYFNFTPTVTTDSMRRRLSKEAAWQVPSKVDETKQRWEMFNYELACSELCGNGHYSMKNLVKIVSEEEYLAWLDEQEGGKVEAVTDTTTGKVDLVYEPGSPNSQYFKKVFNKEGDPLKDKTSKYERLIENKARVNYYMTQLTTARNEAEYKTTAFNNATDAITELKPHLRTARVTADLKASEQAVQQAKEIAEKFAASMTPAKEEAPAEEAITENIDGEAETNAL